MPCSGLLVFWILLRGSFLVYPQFFGQNIVYDILGKNTVFGCKIGIPSAYFKNPAFKCCFLLNNGLK